MRPLPFPLLLALALPAVAQTHDAKRAIETLPENELTAATPVTLRLLLSHMAGTTVHGFPCYTHDAQMPTLAQILEGQPPANTRAVVVDLAPNTKPRYSGGGTTVAQAALVDHLRLPFPDLMRRTVLQPLGMTSSTYEQPLPWSRRAEAATAYKSIARSRRPRSNCGASMRILR